MTPKLNKAEEKTSQEGTMTQKPEGDEGKSQEGPLAKNTWAEEIASAKALRQGLGLFKKLE